LTVAGLKRSEREYLSFLFLARIAKFLIHNELWLGI